MPTRSEERKRFLADIITGAIEGGTGYWAQVSHYQYVWDGQETLCVGRALMEGRGTYAVIHEVNEEEDGYKEEGLEVTIDVIAAGISKVLKKDFKINSQMRHQIATGSASNDASNIDASDADVIVQAALLGDIVYG